MVTLVTMCENGKGKNREVPIQAWTDPEGSRRFKLPEFQDIRHKKVARLLALSTGPLYPPPQEIFLVLVSVRRSVNPRARRSM